MSSDQLLVAAQGAAPASGGAVRDPVVVPMRARPASPTGGPLAPPLGKRTVARIADYFGRSRPQPSADPVAPTAAPVIAHAEEIDWLLRQHIETHLDLMSAQAPDLAQPVENIRRSVALLLKLRAR